MVLAQVVGSGIPRTSDVIVGKTPSHINSPNLNLLIVKRVSSTPAGHSEGYIVKTIVPQTSNKSLHMCMLYITKSSGRFFGHLLVTPTP